jgi:hypothetical protein
MHLLYIERSRQLFQNLYQLLDDLLDPRMYSGMHTTASAPSLRASEPYMMMAQPPPMASDPGNVKVVVRCRAFVRRGTLEGFPSHGSMLSPTEKEKGTKCLIRMDPATQKTTLLAPADDENSSNTRRTYDDKEFTFDRSYWSHDESDPHYAHQEDVYRSFGEEFLDHNFEGYHTCIFAYGQTGSGKSYTMMGSPDNPGLIPRTCEELFDRIAHEPRPDTSYHVQVSYFEVYNEHVRDLLTPRTNPPIYLKIRESQKDGVYVQGLTETEIKSYADIERLLKVGDLVSSIRCSLTRKNTNSCIEPNDCLHQDERHFVTIPCCLHHPPQANHTFVALGRNH